MNDAVLFFGGIATGLVLSIPIFLCVLNRVFVSHQKEKISLLDALKEYMNLAEKLEEKLNGLDEVSRDFIDE